MWQRHHQAEFEYGEALIVLKTAEVMSLPGFESLSLRHRASSATMLHMERVGIRDLRLNASKLMSRVERGESLEVTSRGRLVARIVPVRPAGGLAQLLAEGAATPPEEEGDLLDIPALEPVPEAPLPSQVLAEIRADER